MAQATRVPGPQASSILRPRVLRFAWSGSRRDTELLFLASHSSGLRAMCPAHTLQNAAPSQSSDKCGMIPFLRGAVMGRQMGRRTGPAGGVDRAGA